MVIGKIKSLAGSSKLLFQENFDKASNASPFFAHYRAIGTLVFLLLCSAIVPLALNHPDHRVPRYLQDHGVVTVGLAENVHVKTEPRGRGTRNYITTVDYRFTGPDGKIYHGASSFKGGKPQPVAAGDSIKVVYDRDSPSTNFWQAALIGMEAGVFGSVFAAGLVIPWCIFSLYRYVRWRQHRRSSRAGLSLSEAADTAPGLTRKSGA
jgi:hypothetical protein